MARRRQHFFLGFIAVSIIFILFQLQIDWLALFSPADAVLNVIEALLFFAYASVFLTTLEKRSGKAGLAMKFLFLANIILLIAVLYSSRSMLYLLSSLGGSLFFIMLYFIIILPVYFLIAIGRTLHPFGRGFITTLLLSCSLILLAVYYHPGVIFQAHSISDEMFIVYQGAGSFLHGMDPYNVSVGGAMYSNFTSGYVHSLTLTTTNRLATYLSYPALYMLSFLPFYLSSQPTPQNFDLNDTNAQYVLFIFIALVAIVMALDKEYLKKPIYVLLIFFSFFMLTITSTVAYLLLPVLLLAYLKIGSKYAWLFIAICASFQELLWIPAVLLILYSANNYGIKRGLQNAVGALAIFLLINAYFIALNPSAFFGHVFETLTEFSMPNSTATAGYLILSQYGVLLSSFQTVFDLVLLILVVIFIYTNQKRLVGIFSMLPFIFLSHSITFYFSFFLLFTFIVLFVKDEKRKGYGIFGSWLRKNTAITALAILVLVACIVGVLYLSHAEYQKSFSLSLTNAALTVNNSTNTSVYTATLHYGRLSNYTVYLLFFSANMGNAELHGIFNDSLLNSSVDCKGQNYTCTLNVNRIELNPANSTYYLVATVKAKNQSGVARIVSPRLYNGEYMYIANTTS